MPLNSEKACCLTRTVVNSLRRASRRAKGECERTCGRADRHGLLVGLTRSDPRVSRYMVVGVDGAFDEGRWPSAAGLWQLLPLLCTPYAQLRIGRWLTVLSSGSRIGARHQGGKSVFGYASEAVAAGSQKGADSDGK